MTTALSILKTTERKDKKSAWVEFKEGISFHVNFVSRARLKRITENATSFRYNAKTRVREPQMNNDQFSRDFIMEAVNDWKGVTARSLSKIVDVDISEIPDDMLDDPLDYDSEAMARLLNEAYDLDSLLQDFALDVKNFSASSEDDEKNS